MTNDKRSLGEPYLQDQNVIFILAQVWTTGFIDSDNMRANYISAFYNRLNPYRNNIDDDYWMHYNVVGLNEKSKWNDLYLNRYPNLNELAHTFNLNLKEDFDSGRFAEYRSKNKEAKTKSFHSDIETYISAIATLYHIVREYESIMSNIYNAASYNRELSLKTEYRLKMLFAKGKFKDINNSKLETLDKYFEPDEALTDRELTDIIIELCDSTYKKGDTPIRLKSLNGNFTPKRNYKSLGITEKYKVCGDIFGINADLIGRNIRNYKELGQLRNLWEG